MSRTRPWATLGAAALAAAVVVRGGQALAGRLPAPAGPTGAMLFDAGFTLLLFGLLAAVAWVGASRAHVPLAVGPRPAGAALLGLACGGGVLLAAVADAGLAGAVQRVDGPAVALGALLAGTVAVAAQAGAEELFFRGWLQPALARDWPRGAALLATALAFAALHLLGGARAPLSLLNLLLAGLLFGLLRDRTGGLAAPAAAHILYNWAETLLLGLDPNPGRGGFGAVVDLDLVGSTWWGGSGEGLNASLGLSCALAAVVLPLAAAGRIGRPTVPA